MSTDLLEPAEVRSLPHAEQVKLAADLAVADSLAGDPQPLGELWLQVEELANRAKAAKDTATKILATGKLAEKESEELSTAILEAISGRGLDKADAGYGLLRVKANGGNQAVCITGVVPAEYTVTKTSVANDLKKIGAALKNGDVLNFAILEPRGNHVSLESL